MDSEPQFLAIGLYAWVLQHAKDAEGHHDATDACTYGVSRKCQFAVCYSTMEDPTDADFAEAQLVPVPLDPSAANTPVAVALVPLGTGPPVVIKVTATPTKRTSIRLGAESTSEIGYFPGSALFIYAGNGAWSRRNRSELEEEEACGSHFAPPAVLAGTTPIPFVFAFISFFLSRVRDCTLKALRALEPARETSDGWLAQILAFRSLAVPPVADHRLQFSTNQLDIDTELRIFEIKGFKAPSLIATCWPGANAMPSADPSAGLRAAPLEALIFFHASYGQNASIYGRSTYPFGFEYVEHGIGTYLQPSDPLLEAYPLSLPHQIAAAGRHTVLLLPMNRLLFPELGNLNAPEQTIELLEELHAAFLRFAGRPFCLPHTGRLGIASFSAGVQELLLFKQGAVSHKLLRALVQEIYVFDSRHSDPDGVSAMAEGLKAWAGNVPDRRVRIYNNISSEGHRRFVGAATLPQSPFVVDSKDGRFTTGVVSDADWLHANVGVDAFKPVPSPSVFKSTLKTSLGPGGVILMLESTTHLRVDDRLVINRMSVHRVSRISGASVTVSPPVAVECKAGDLVWRFVPNDTSTTLAADAEEGSPSITVASPGTLGADDRILIADADFYNVASVAANEVSLRTPLRSPRKRGDPLTKFQPFAAVRLSMDASSGATEVAISSDNSTVLLAGDTVAFGWTEIGTLTAVNASRLKLNHPLSGDHAEGTLVAKMVPRVLDWGIYHAMFVSTFLTDAMRKSGFT